MPNWCHNRVTVSFNDSPKSAEVLELFKEVDEHNRPALFDKVLPKFKLVEYLILLLTLFLIPIEG